MAVATLVLPSKGGIDRDEHEVDRGRKERKLMRLREPAPEEEPTLQPRRQDSHSTFGCMTSDNLRQVMGFLDFRDSFALLSTHRRLMEEPLAIKYSSFCGLCTDCTANNQHMCVQGDKARPASFWRCLVNHGGLQELRLADCTAFSAATLLSVQPDALARGLGSLKVVDLNRCSALGSDGLFALADACSSLQELRLRDMVVESAAFARLVDANRVTLRSVDLLGCHTIKGDDVRCLVACDHLQDLSLWGCHNVENAAIAEVVRAQPALTGINLRYCHKVDDKLVLTIAEHLPKLRELNLRYCYKVTDKAVAAICSSLGRLQKLNLSQCSKITDAAIYAITTKLTSLKELRLWGCVNLTSDAVYAITCGLPELRLVDLRSRDKLEAVIGGAAVLRYLGQSFRDSTARWLPAEDVGVFKLHPMCAVVA